MYIFVYSMYKKYVLHTWIYTLSASDIAAERVLHYFVVKMTGDLY